MITGVFDENTPLFNVVVAWGRAVQSQFVVLDTGFTGDLQVTPQMAKDLGLAVASVTRMKDANGEVKEKPTALAFATMEGETETIDVLISESDPLAGISFLSKFGYKATVDCKYRTVQLEKA